MSEVLSRGIRGCVSMFAELTSTARKIWIRVQYPGVRFVGECFLDRGVRIRAVRQGKVEIIGCHVARDVHIEAGPGAQIRIEADFIGPRSMIVAQQSIEIGAGSKIAEMAVIRDADHAHDRPLADMAFVSEPIAIGEDVWLGAGACVLKGVAIASHATVAAGAVVTRNVPSRATVAGVPAKIIDTASGRRTD